MPLVCEALQQAQRTRPGKQSAALLYTHSLGAATPFMASQLRIAVLENLLVRRYTKTVRIDT